MKKDFFCLFMALTMLAALLPTMALAKSVFNDVDGDEYYAEAAEALEALSILEGYEDGSFGAAKDITRAEMAAVICRMLGKEDDAEDAEGATDFDDVCASHWASGYINYASENGVIEGDGDGKFRPEDNVKYEEALKMIVCALGLADDVTVDPDNWSAEYIAIAKENGITDDVTGRKGKASPRGDVAVMVYNGLTMDLSAPAVSLDGGDYTGTKKVTLSSSNKNAEIYYTTDGSTPTVKSTKYTKEISVSKSMTLKAIAVIDGVLISDVASESYTITSASGGGGGGGGGSSSRSTPKPTTEPVAAYSRGEWIQLFAEKLGFDLASIDAENWDYVYADTMNSEYGLAIEMAEAYQILPEPTTEGYEDPEQDIPYFYPDETMTREFAAYVVAAAMGYSGEYTVDCKDYDDILYYNEVSVIVQQGFMSLTNNYFNPTAPTTELETNQIFNRINELEESTHIDISETHENVEYADNIIKDELNDITDYTLAENEDETISVVLPKNNATLTIQPDTVFVLPANDETITSVALKAVSITDNGDGTLSIICCEPDLAEVVTDIDYADIISADVSNFIPADDMEMSYDPTGSIEDDTVNIFDINAGGSLKIPGKVELTFADKQITENLKASGKVSFEIPDITAKVNASIGLLSGVDINELVLSISEKIKVTGSLTYTLAEGGYELTNSSGNTRWEAGKIEIGRIGVPLGSTGLSVDLVFFF